MSGAQAYSLKTLNSFGIDVFCKNFAIISHENELVEAISTLIEPWMVLGGGSNVLFKSDFPGTVLKINILGKQILREDDRNVYVEVGAGEVWHELVMWAVENEYGGIENLALIPGSVGAAPIQNIGAYGVEIKEVFESLSCLNILTGKMESFSNEQCEFDYRESIFKTKKRGQYIICKLVLRLNKKPHKTNIEYTALAGYLNEKQIINPNIRDIREAVISIRQSKLPDPKVIGNAGSFFKNPLIPIQHYNSLKELYPHIPSYPVDERCVKVPAAWLIDQCGWKGKRFGDAGVFPKQALVIVNYGNATGEEIVSLARRIQKSVLEKFEIQLVPEVNIV